MADMRLIVLGSGTCVPSLRRNAPGYYLETGYGEYLVDCGSGTLLQLERAGKSYKDIDSVFLTHLHPDHVSDLMPFLHALLATPDFTREKRLTIVGPEGTRRFYERCILSVIRKPKTFLLDLIEIEDKLHLDSLHIFSRKTIHSENSIAYRFEDGRKSLVITGDCDYDRNLEDFARDTSLLVADCSFPDAMKVRGHLTSRECGLIAQKARVRKLLLSHLYPSPYPDADRLKECREVFHGDVLLAEDLMEIVIE